MIVVKVEDYVTCEPELREIYPQHWRELAADPDIPLEPRYDVYRNACEAHTLVLVTARHNGRLVGYFIGVLMQELHYASCFACYGDIFYVLPEYRKGIVGVRLFRKVEEVLRQRGVKRWHVGSKIAHDSGALLRRIGLKPVEVLYSKRLD